MKKQFLLTLSILLFFIFAVSVQQAQAQEDDVQGRYGTGRLTNLTRDLIRQTVDLVDRTSEDLKRNPTNTRADIENAFLASQVDAVAHVFDDMVRGGRRAAELRDGISILSDLTRRAPAFGANGALWRDVQRTVGDIQRELGVTGGGGNPNPNPTPEPPVIGRVFWRGKVDIETQLYIKGGNLETRVTAGPNWGGESSSFTSPLPSRPVSVGVYKKKGRGNVRVLQQPSKANDFTAVIQITDPDSGWKEYEMEIVWR
ncbi:MAG: hypothetical protein M3384_17965 [Acidobacteriota bacterium]|nr:hypothetical protein [Acidobacteriota bacterium]